MLLTKRLLKTPNVLRVLRALRIYVRRKVRVSGAVTSDSRGLFFSTALCLDHARAA